MYISINQLINSLRRLKKIHPFFGITFLACKKEQLPVGRVREFPMDSVTHDFLEKYHRINPESKWFFQPYKSTKDWVKHDYPSSGLQAINTQTFKPAFLHERNSRVWGWSDNYIDVLKERLHKKTKLSVFDLAVWLLREREWPVNSNAELIVNHFIADFNITKHEITDLFDISIPSDADKELLFQKDMPSWNDLRANLPAPPDAKPEEGGILGYLEIEGLGPADHIVLEPAKRLTLITGDNGLGKTFLLECAWWALTGVWAERPAYPRSGNDRVNAQITFRIEGEKYKPDKKSIAFDWKSLSWPVPKKRPTMPGLTVYARVDGSFSIWDPAKIAASSVAAQPVYSGSDVWDGLQGQIEGLIRDWVRWQSNPSKYPFEMFCKVLERLSPPDMGTLLPGEPVRIPGDPRDIPTIKHPYGETPIVYTSAGVRRIITLAYLVVWAWNEHVVAADLARSHPQRRMVVLVDEMEAHLHPRWQREVLPSLMTIGDMLTDSLDVQFIIATHSPLVMASAESFFDEDIDSLVHLSLSKIGKVTLEELGFSRFGDISSWLTSPVFELKQARSSEAEAAIEFAKKIQSSKDITKEDIENISSQLIKYLAPDDKFWPRWISFAEKYEVFL